MKRVRPFWARLPPRRRDSARGGGFGLSRSRVGALLLTSLALLGQGCHILRAPQKMVSAVIPGGTSKPDPVDLQLQLQRYSDDFTARIAQALDEYALRAGTGSARVEAKQLKLAGGSSMVSIASGPNPSANLLDMVSVAVLTRTMIEDYWVKRTNGAAFQPWLEASKELETNAWQLAAAVLKAPQLEELRTAITNYYQRNPQVRNAFFMRPQDFSSMVRNSREKEADANSVFSWVNLDPMSGLDPAVREVTRTRLFAERAMFIFQRMPFLIRLHAELLAHDWAQLPEVQTALTNTTRLSESADRISRATESVSRTAASLPDRLSTERKEILAALEQQESKLRELASAVDRSLVSGEKMSTSLNTTITSFDGLMKRFGIGEPKANKVQRTNAPPFNILDWAETAEQVGEMAKELNTLLVSADQNLPEIQRIAQQAGADARQVVDRSFRLGLVLIAVLLLGGLLTALAYRIISNKLTPREHLSPSSKPL